MSQKLIQQLLAANNLQVPFMKRIQENLMLKLGVKTPEDPAVIDYLTNLEHFTPTCLAPDFANYKLTEQKPGIYCPHCHQSPLCECIFQCKHVMCNGCSINMHTCPQCGEKIRLKLLNPRKLDLNALVLCPASKSGCNFVGTLVELEQHLKICSFINGNPDNVQISSADSRPEATQKPESPHLQQSAQISQSSVKQESRDSNTQQQQNDYYPSKDDKLQFGQLINNAENATESPQVLTFSQLNSQTDNTQKQPNSSTRMPIVSSPLRQQVVAPKADSPKGITLTSAEQRLRSDEQDMLKQIEQSDQIINTLNNIDKPIALIPREQTQNIDINTDYQSDQETREIKELIERQKQHLQQSEVQVESVLQPEKIVEPNPLDQISLQKQTDYVNAFNDSVKQQESQQNQSKSVEQLMAELRQLSANQTAEVPMSNPLASQLASLQYQPPEGSQKSENQMRIEQMQEAFNLRCKTSGNNPSNIQQQTGQQQPQRAAQQPQQTVQRDLVMKAAFDVTQLNPPTPIISNVLKQSAVMQDNCNQDKAELMMQKGQNFQKQQSLEQDDEYVAKQIENLQNEIKNMKRAEESNKSINQVSVTAHPTEDQQQSAQQRIEPPYQVNDIQLPPCAQKSEFQNKVYGSLNSGSLQATLDTSSLAQDELIQENIRLKELVRTQQQLIQELENELYKQKMETERFQASQLLDTQPQIKCAQPEQQNNNLKDVYSQQTANLLPNNQNTIELSQPTIVSSRGQSQSAAISTRPQQLRASSAKRSRSSPKTVNSSFVRLTMSNKDMPRRPMSTIDGPIGLPPTQDSQPRTQQSSVFPQFSSQHAHSSQIEASSYVPNTTQWPKVKKPTRRSVTASVDEKIREIKKIKAQRYRK